MKPTINTNIEALWPASLQVALKPEQVVLPSLNDLQKPGLSLERRATLAQLAVIEAVNSQYKEGEERSLLEFVGEVRTKSFPGVSFQDKEGELSFRSLVRLLEYAAKAVQDYGDTQVAGGRSSLHYPDCFTCPADMLSRAAYMMAAHDHDEAAKEKYRGRLQRCAYHIDALELFTPALPPHERLQDLRAIFSEIILHQNEGTLSEYDRSEADSFNGARYAYDRTSKRYQGYDLLNLYRDTLLELYPTKPRYDDNQPRQFAQVIADVEKNGMESHLSRAQELSIFAAFDYSPSRIFQAWALVHNAPLSSKSREAFTKRYPGLFIETPKEHIDSLYPDHEPPKSPRKFLIELVMGLHRYPESQEQQFYRSEARKGLLSRLLLSLSRKEVEENGRSETSTLLQQSGEWFQSLVGDGYDPAILQFVADAHKQVAEELDAPLLCENANLTISLQEYQKEGATFLLRKKRAILGDAFSLGKTVQAVAAAEVAQVKRVIWITDATNRLNIQKEVRTLTGLDEKNVVVLPPPSQWGASPVALPKDAKYLVVSYDTLREIEKKAKRHEDWKKLQDELRGQVVEGESKAVVIDESQYMDNPDALRTKAVQSLQADYAWLLSATPFQNNIRSLFHVLNYLDPEVFPSRSDFRQDYFSNDEGFERFLGVFQEYFLGREQTEVGVPFMPFDKESLQSQLDHGLPRFAVPVRFEGKNPDRIIIPDDVSETYRGMVEDTSRWTSPLQKFQALMALLYEPQKEGLALPHYLYQGVAAIAEEHLQDAAKKVIIFTRNLSVMHGVQEVLGDKAAVFYGDTSPRERERLQQEFAYSDNLRVLVIQHQTGGVGLSFRRADAVIHAQPALSVSLHAQSEGRAPRNVYPGEKDVAGMAKVEISYHYPVLAFSEKFLCELGQEEREQIYSHGTLSEIAAERLIGSNKVYEFLRAGAGQGGRFETVIQQGILAQAGLSAKRG